MMHIYILFKSKVETLCCVTNGIIAQACQKLLEDLNKIYICNNNKQLKLKLNLKLWLFLAKWSQHFYTRSHYIAGCSMLHTFDHPVGSVASFRCCCLRFDHFKFKLEIVNNTQHVTTGQNTQHVTPKNDAIFYTEILWCVWLGLNMTSRDLRQHIKSTVQPFVYLIS